MAAGVDDHESFLQERSAVRTCVPEGLRVKVPYGGNV
jgi:hypothetical protein